MGPMFVDLCKKIAKTLYPSIDWQSFLIQYIIPIQAHPLIPFGDEDWFMMLMEG